MTQSKMTPKLSLTYPSVSPKDGKRKNPTEKNLYNIKKPLNNKPPKPVIKLKATQKHGSRVTIPVCTKNTPADNYQTQDFPSLDTTAPADLRQHEGSQCANPGGAPCNHMHESSRNPGSARVRSSLPQVFPGAGGHRHH